MTIVSGSRLGPYEIVAPLGAGGMGEVYRARDSKLNREVAIKVLPEGFAQDAERLASYDKGRVVQGVIGSGEIWNIELDRIQRFRTQFATSAEEMETASAAQIAAFFQIPFLGIRVLSYNITNGRKYDAKTGGACQEYVYDVVKADIDTTLKH